MSGLQTQIENAIQNEDFDEVKAKLQSAIDLYYTRGESPLTDEQFDNYLETYIDLSGDVGFRDAKLSVTALKRAKTAQINFPSLCAWLDKSNSPDDTANWLRLSKHNTDDEFCLSFKYDGMSIVHEYNLNGTLQYAVTRGDSNLAVDYTEFFKNDVKSYFCVDAIREFIKANEITDCIKFAVKYEACISYENLAKLNSQLPEDKQYKNPRNTIAGLFRKDDGYKFRQYISLIPIDIEFENNDLLNTFSKSERIELISSLIDTNTDYFNCDFDWWVWDTFKVNNSDELEEYLVNLTDEYRAESPYMLDGIVIEYNNPDKVDELGGFSETPPHVLGWKFPTTKFKTNVISCDWDYGRTGRRTPVINFEPVVINGNTYKRTSISNLLRFDVLDLRPGSPVIFELRGEVIGYLNKDRTRPASNNPPFELPEDIIEITYNQSGDRVFAYSTPTIGDKVESFIIAANIKGIKLSTIDSVLAGMHKLGKSFNSVAEFFTECFDTDISQFENIGVIKANYFKSAISQKNDSGINSWEILSALNIISVGSDIAKRILFNTHLTLKEITDIIVNGDTEELNRLNISLLAVDGLAEKRLANVYDGILKHSSDIYDYYSMMNILDNKPVILSNADSLTIVVTGELNNWSDRGDFKQLLESLGHKLTSSISGKTNYLVTNDTNLGTVKIKKAIEKGVKVVTEMEICELLGINNSESEQVNSSDEVSPDTLF